MDKRAESLNTRVLQPVRRTSGFSLVELLVGVVVALITLLMMVQSVSVFEGQKRVSTGSADAQENGDIAMYLIGSDIRQGGYGFVTSNGLACALYSNGVVSNAPIAPVRIVAATAAASDTITVTYSDSAAGAIPVGLLLPAPLPAPGGAVIKAQAPSTAAVNTGDIVLLSTPQVPPSPTAIPVAGLPTTCTMAQVSAVSQAIDSIGITIGAYPANQTLSYPPGVTYDISPQSYLYDMGSLINKQYQVMCHTLVVSNPITTAAAPGCTANPLTFNNATSVSDNIVMLKAQYGVAAAPVPAGNVGGQTVVCWVNATATGNPCDTADWSTPSATNIQRIKAIRLAIVSRSYEPDRAHAEPNCTNISGTQNIGPCLWPDSVANPAPRIDLSGTPNWQNYRYRVFTAIIPLRNVIWANL